jgi:DNA recombination protein RmuC
MVALILLALALGVALGALWSSSRARAAHEAALQERAALAASLEAERRAGAEKLELLHDAETKLRDAFSALSSEALKQNTESFLHLARASLGEFQKTATMDLDGRHKAIDTLVAPLRESLTRVDTKLNEVERGRASSQAQLSEQLRSLSQTQQVLHSETTKLARALRSPNVRGQWGEIQLRRILESAGLLQEVHFDFKDSAQTDDGRVSPDVVIKLPGGKNVVVDAKVPLAAYLDAMETDEDQVRDAKLKDHARQLKEHVNRLANKNYWAHFQPAPDIVVMFVPGEALLSSAMQHDAALLEFSMGKGIMLASPLSLIALLKAIAYGWQQDTVAKNAQEISDLGRNLYDRIAKLAEHFENVGRSLAKAVQSYNGAIGTLESRVLVTARRLKDKGVSPSEEFRELETVDQTPRLLGAPELVGLFDDTSVEAEIIADVAEPDPADLTGARRLI